MDDIKQMVAAVQGYVRRCLSPITERMKGLEDRAASLAEQIKAIPAGPRGEAGERGGDGTPGRDGLDGKDADPAVIEAAVERGIAAALPGAVRAAIDAMMPELIAKAAAAVPPPSAGKDGAPGADGKDGEPGKSLSIDDIRPLLDDLFAKAVPEWIARVNKAIADLPVPKDGTGVTVEDFRQLFEAEQAKWALDFERRAADLLQRAVDKFPAPKDGRDALELEDLTVEHDGDGGVTLRFVRGELAKEFTLRLPRFKDCGVFREGVEHKAGDGVTWGGSFFIAQKDAPVGKPGEGEDWRLAVKRGRDGKDAGTAPAVAALPVRLK